MMHVIKQIRGIVSYFSLSLALKTGKQCSVVTALSRKWNLLEHKMSLPVYSLTRRTHIVLLLLLIPSVMLETEALSVHDMKTFWSAKACPYLAFHPTQGEVGCCASSWTYRTVEWTESSTMPDTINSFLESEQIVEKYVPNSCIDFQAADEREIFPFDIIGLDFIDSVGKEDSKLFGSTAPVNSWCSTTAVYSYDGTEEQTWGFCVANQFTKENDFLELSHIMDRFLSFDNDTVIGATDGNQDGEEDGEEPVDDTRDVLLGIVLPVVATLFVIALLVFAYRTWARLRKEKKLEEEEALKNTTDIIGHTDYRVNIECDEIQVELPSAVLSVYRRGQPEDQEPLLYN